MISHEVLVSENLARLIQCYLDVNPSMSVDALYAIAVSKLLMGDGNFPHSHEAGKIWLDTAFGEPKLELASCQNVDIE